jgi:hypothetical protein
MRHGRGLAMLCLSLALVAILVSVVVIPEVRAGNCQYCSSAGQSYQPGQHDLFMDCHWDEEKQDCVVIWYLEQKCESDKIVGDEPSCLDGGLLTCTITTHNIEGRNWYIPAGEHNCDIVEPGKCAWDTGWSGYCAWSALPLSYKTCSTG